jgi:hypothetical protein
VNYVKLGAYGLVAVLIIALGARWHHAVYKAGEEHIQTQWDADKEAIAKVAADAVVAANKARDEALAANEGITSDYQNQLSQAGALNDSLSQRLRDYQARAHRGSLPQAPGDPGTAAAGPNPSLGRLDDLVAASLTECADNRAQLNALIAEIRPQL